MKPFVGLPTTGEGCSYAADIDAAPCGRPPQVHVEVSSEAWGVVALATCDEHHAIARAAGIVLDEHPFTDACTTTDCWEAP